MLFLGFTGTIDSIQIDASSVFLPLQMPVFARIVSPQKVGLPHRTPEGPVFEQLDIRGRRNVERAPQNRHVSTANL